MTDDADPLKCSRMNNTFERIREKRAQLAREIEEAEARLHELTRQAELFEAAEEAMALLGEQPSQPKMTMQDAIQEVLKNDGPMESNQLYRRLRTTWRADLAKTSLQSTLSRLKTNGALELNHGIWSIAPDLGQQNTSLPSGSEVSVDDAPTSSFHQPLDPTPGVKE